MIRSVKGSAPKYMIFCHFSVEENRPLIEFNLEVLVCSWEEKHQENQNETRSNKDEGWNRWMRLANRELNIDSSTRLHWSCFASLCNWSGKFQQSFQPIKCKINRNLVTRDFPCCKQFTCVNFNFPLVNFDINLCFDWPLWLLGVWTLTLNWKVL